VDVTDKTDPFFVEGETKATAVGTAQAVLYKNNRVYVTLGDKGVAAYNTDNLSSRTIYETGTMAEDLSFVGTEHIAVTTYSALKVYKIGTGTNLDLACTEQIYRLGAGGGPNTIRAAMGLGATDDSRILVASWNWVEVYQLKEFSQSTQPDINCSDQRIRFAPTGGSTEITLVNNGQGLLQISSVEAEDTGSPFTTDFSGTMNLAPGQSRNVTITYTPSFSGEDKDNILVYSNDPDEDPACIQVRGRTNDLDPGEEAVDFTLDTFQYNSDTGLFDIDTFTLSEHAGKVIWLGVFASW